MRKLTPVGLFAAALTCGAGVALAASLHAHGLGNWKAVAILCVIALVAEGRAMRISTALELTVSFIPMVLAAVLFGPGAGALVGLAAMLGDRDSPRVKWIVYAADRTLAGAAAGAVALAVEQSLGNSTLLEVLAATVAAAFAMAAVDAGVNITAGVLRKRVTPTEHWRLLRGTLTLTLTLYTPLTALYAYAYLQAGMIVLAFFAIPLLAAHLSHSLFARQAQLIEDLTAANTRLETANARLHRVNLSFAASMVRVLEARDQYTAGHSLAVAHYARDIATEIGLPPSEIDLVYLIGLVHDIGKIGLRAEVLQKAAALNDEEWAEMRRHSEIGETILLEVEDYAEVAQIVRSHHERVDGAGYPDGLSRERIPTLARVIAVGDAYNAMTSDRPYRKAMAPDVAITQLVNGRGTQFEPDLVDAFVRVLERESESYRLGVHADFSLDSLQHQQQVPAQIPQAPGQLPGHAAVA